MMQKARLSRLNLELDNRPWRVRVVTEANCSVPEASAASSVDDAGEATRELPDKTKRRIERIARDANQCEAQLSALQEYVRGVLKLIDTHANINNNLTKVGVGFYSFFSMPAITKLLSIS